MAAYRPATAPDIPDIARVFIETRTRCLPYLNWEYDHAIMCEVFSPQLDHASFWVAEDGQLIGFLAFDTYEIDHLYVLPEFHGRGIGKALLNIALDGTRGDVRLWAFQQNSQARAFYERSGFGIEFETDGSGNMEKTPDVRYVLKRALRLAAEAPNLHGFFSKDLEPVATIQPGQTVSFQCLDSNWGLEPYNGVDLNRSEHPDRQEGHALTGPVAIAGAKPGMTLAIRIGELLVGDWGTTFAGGWPCAWNDRLGISGHGVGHVWSFDEAKAVATNQHGHSVTLRPFMGILGMPEDAEGQQSTVPPRRTGGNIDCRELVPGTTLYLPIEVDGGLFSTGDGHGLQGDGEVAITAMEIPVESVDLTFELIEDLHLNLPVANTPAGWVAMAFSEDLDEAMGLALESMLALMKREFGLERLDALALASLCVSLRITQVVNGVRGVHAILPHGSIAFPS